MKKNMPLYKSIMSEKGLELELFPSNSSYDGGLYFLLTDESDIEQFSKDFPSILNENKKKFMKTSPENRISLYKVLNVIDKATENKYELASIAKNYRKKESKRQKMKKLGLYSIGFLTALGISLYGFSANLDNKSDKSQIQDNQIKIEQKVDNYSIDDITIDELVSYSSSNLLDKQLYGHQAAYVGSNSISDGYDADFKSILEKRWDIKLSEYGSNSDIDNLLKNQVDLYTENNSTKMNITDYMKTIDDSLDLIMNNLDWESLGNMKRLNSDELETLKNVYDSIDSKAIMSFYLTELMPGFDGENSSELYTQNIDVFDYLLQNAGREFVELLPAEYDKFCSYGPGQHTINTISKVKNVDGTYNYGNSSLINTCMPEEYKISNNIYELKNNDHHIATGLNIIYNLSNAISSMNENQYSQFKNNFISSDDELVQMIATYHHSPKNALRATLFCLDNNVENDFSVSCNADILQYANKTKGNYQALNDYFN
jgi:hypothetical protein